MYIAGTLDRYLQIHIESSKIHMHKSRILGIKLTKGLNNIHNIEENTCFFPSTSLLVLMLTKMHAGR